MKKRTKKIFLPKWQRYFIVPFFIAIWAFTAYMEFFSEEKGDMGMGGFLFMTLILLGVSVMIFLMTTGTLPAYMMEEEVDEEKPERDI